MYTFSGDFNTFRFLLNWLILSEKQNSGIKGCYANVNKIFSVNDFFELPKCQVVRLCFQKGKTFLRPSIQCRVSLSLSLSLSVSLCLFLCLSFYHFLSIALYVCLWLSLIDIHYFVPLLNFSSSVCPFLLPSFPLCICSILSLSTLFTSHVLSRPHRAYRQLSQSRQLIN